MKKGSILKIGIISIVFVSIGTSQIKSISPFEANKHIGKIVEVCGTVVTAYHDEEVPNSPTYLNLDEAYPNQIFTIFIPGSARNKFDTPPDSIFLNKKVCVIGLVKEYNNKPEMVVNNPTQIRIVQLND